MSTEKKVATVKHHITRTRSGAIHKGSHKAILRKAVSITGWQGHIESYEIRYDDPALGYHTVTLKPWSN